LTGLAAGQAAAQEIRRFQGHTDRIHQAVFSPDGKLLALDFVTDVYVVKLADVISGKLDPRMIQYPDYEERQALAGTWKVVSSHVGGKPTEKAPLSQFQFAVRKISVREGQKIGEFGYHLDTTKEPREITLSDLSGRGGDTILGIYRLTGDALVICLGLRPGVPVPRDFENTEDENSILLRLEREDGRAGKDSQP
jgi:uncharacterized protein (TIGR03067 family)